MIKQFVSGLCCSFVLLFSAAHAAEVPLHWLQESHPFMDTGVSFGVPWPRGSVSPDTKFSLRVDGKPLALQSWPLAYWPDGSLKWSGFATVAPAGFSGTAQLSTSAQADAANGVSAGAIHVTQDGSTILVDTGALVCKLSTSGENLFDSLSIQGQPVTGAGKLVCVLQDGPATEETDSPKRENFVSAIKKVAVEQSGPVRAVVRVEGVHRGLQSHREWLPFTVRLYFYHGQTAIRVVHSIVFDGDQEKDFVRGLGLHFDVPLRDPAPNRYVRFAGKDGGVWSEPLQPGGGNPAQESGEAFTGREGFSENAVWDDFKLIQPNPGGFTIVKRTNPQSTWLFSAAGERSDGLAFVGDLKGGLGVSIKNFWQSFPTSLEVRHANSPTASLVAWLWSPDGPQMDMRHYDIRAHGLLTSYEDVQPGMSAAYGVARTSELMLYPESHLPARAATSAQARAGTALPLFASTPEYIHSTGVFGVWSLPDRSTAFKKSVEDGLDSVLAYYEGQVDQRDWYGFWQYGDFMHSYSAPRHVWHYDWGGHAWDNTELGVPLWLWYSFLRTGRADLFRLAEAHTRNTSETDVYHLGPMAGLGSRHNVVKWGDGAKEARISQAAHWRVYYYLTSDERTGDLMRATTHSDEAAVHYDPMREAEPQVPGEPVFKNRIRIGPDWFALAGNWMTEWERTGDTRWRDRILAGVDSILAMPFWLQTGQLNGLNPNLKGGAIGPLNGGGSMTVGYDLETGKLSAIRDPLTKEPVPVSYNLATIQGGAEVMFELVPLLGRADFAKAWLQYCRLGNATAEMLTRDRETGSEGNDAKYLVYGQGAPRLAAYAYAQTKIPAFADFAVTKLLAQSGGIAHPHTLTPPAVLKPVEEALDVSTNSAAQTGLMTIEILELCKDHLPSEEAKFSYRPFGEGAEGRPSREGRAPRQPGETPPRGPIKE